MSNKKTFNPLKTSSKRRAFSLIELSIVLIIIGLLIAGITGGASLIKSASLRAAMGEARGYNVAVNSFYVQFDGLPGDYATPINAATANINTPNSIAGNANSRIEHVNALATTAGVAEGINAWAALKNSGVIDTQLTFNVPASGFTMLPGTAAFPAQVAGTNFPGSKIKSAGWIFDYVGTQNVVILTGSLALGAIHASVAENAVPVKIITPSDALSIDTKMDDGIANAGKVRGMLSAGNTTLCYGTTAYNTNNTSNECALSFQVDIT